MRRRLAVWMAVVAQAAACASDPTEGWSTAPMHSRDVGTVAVSILENDTYDRDIEYELADALVKEIEARTPYKVTSRARADTILTGRIRDVRRQQLSKSSLTGLSEEVTVGVTIDLQWRDLRTGATLLDLESFTAHGMFVPSNPTREPIETGQYEVAQRLARDIVTEMGSGW